MPAKLLHRLKINEVSSVPRGAGEGVRIVLMKRDFSAKERKHAASTGAAMPDGSFPIHNEEDLHNAIRLAGNAKNPAAAKEHIKQRAESMGMSSAIPDDWKEDDTAKGIIDLPAFLGDDLSKNLYGVAVAHGANEVAVAKARVAMTKALDNIDKIQDEEQQRVALEKSLTQCIDFLARLVPAAKVDVFKAAVAAITVEKENPMTEAEKKAAEEKEKAREKEMEKLKETCAKQSRQIGLLMAKADHRDFIVVAKLDDAAIDAFLAKSDDEREAFVKAEKKKKKPEHDDEDDKTEKAIAKAIAESPLVKSLQATIEKLTGDTSLEAFKKQAVDLGLPAAHGEVMMKAFKGDPDAIKKHTELLKALVAQDRTAAIFKEFGDNGAQTGATAYEQICAKAEELRKHDPSLSPQQARAKIISNPANRDLVARNKQEETARRKAA